MSISIAAFRERYSEFAAVADAAVQIALDDAALQIDETAWGKFYEVGVYALAAHFLAMRAQESGSSGAGADGVGPIYSETVGPLNYKRAVSPVSADSDTAYYSSTSYGSRYLQLLALVKPAHSYMVIADATITLDSLGPSS